MSRSVVSLCMVAACCLALTGNAEEARVGFWPQWRGPQRNGMSAETGLHHDWKANPPRLLWNVEGLGSGYAGVSLANGRIYTTGNTRQGQAVICRNAADGSELWSTPVTDGAPRHGYGGSRCTPSLDGDHIYAVTSNGQLTCLDQAGKLVWKREFSEWKGKMMSGWGFSESPLVDGDWVLCTPGGQDAALVALDKRTGEEVWRSELPPLEGAAARNGRDLRDGAGYSSIVVSKAAGVKQYVQLMGRGLVGVRASDGKYLWSYHDVANTTANIPTPIVDGDFVFASSGYGTGSALLKLSKQGDGVVAEEQYFLDQNVLQNHHGGMVLVDGHVYCGHRHNNGFPICVELATGKVVWGGDTRGPGSGSAAVTFADGHLVFRYQSGEVALIEATPTEYRLKGVLKPDFQQGNSWAHPVIAGGRLYLREQDRLMCYELTD